MNAEMQREPVRQKVVWGSRIRLAARAAAAVLLALLTTSCSNAIRTGQSPAYLILVSLQGAKGGGSNSLSFASNLSSDVITLVPPLTGTATVFNDLGQATLQLQLRDQGGPTTPNTPSPANAITLTQYHVKYIRTDGRNTQGVDVPFEFDGGLGITVANSSTVGFMLVRNQAKLEAPLKALANNFEVISMIAEVTFYGHDQNGREVSVSGNIDVAFANFGD
jgi:hypothetical protein